MIHSCSTSTAPSVLLLHLTRYHPYLRQFYWSGSEYQVSKKNKNRADSGIKNLSLWTRAPNYQSYASIGDPLAYATHLWTMSRCSETIWASCWKMPPSSCSVDSIDSMAVDLLSMYWLLASTSCTCSCCWRFWDGVGRSRDKISFGGFVLELGRLSMLYNGESPTNDTSENNAALSTSSHVAQM